jgi:hypothetical protein
MIGIGVKKIQKKVKRKIKKFQKMKKNGTIGEMKKKIIIQMSILQMITKINMSVLEVILIFQKMNWTKLEKKN